MNKHEMAIRMGKLYDIHRLGHAYLLLGEHPSFLVETVQLITEVLFCKKALVHGEACHQCDECIRIASGNHLGISWLKPDGASLKIAQMRAAWSADTRKENGVKLRVIVVEDAHKLTPEATNAILKWVEEPGENRLFLFLTISLSAILPTLRSRCAILRMDHRGMETPQEARDPLLSLWEEVDKETDDEKNMLKFADTVALVLKLGQSIAKQDPHAWHFIAERFAKMNYSTAQANVIVDLFSAYFRDLIAVACSLPVSYYTAHSEQLQKVAQASQVDRYARIALEMSTLRRRLASHVQIVTALEAVFIRVQREPA